MPFEFAFLFIFIFMAIEERSTRYFRMFQNERDDRFSCLSSKSSLELFHKYKFNIFHRSVTKIIF